MTEQSSNNGLIHKRVLIGASPDIVFEALTDSRNLVHWFCDRASSVPETGGELSAAWRTGKTIQKGRAVYRRVVPNSEIELLWIDDGRGPDPEHAHHVLSYFITARKGGCELEMIDRDFPPPDEQTYAFLDEGWNGVLLELKDFCERRERSGKSHAGDREE